MQGEKYDVEFTVWCDGLRVTLEEIYDENSTRLRVRDNRSDDDYVLSFSVRPPPQHKPQTTQCDLLVLCFSNMPHCDTRYCHSRVTTATCLRTRPSSRQSPRGAIPRSWSGPPSWMAPRRTPAPWRFEKQPEERHHLEF